MKELRNKLRELIVGYYYLKATKGINDIDTINRAIKIHIMAQDYSGFEKDILAFKKGKAKYNYKGEPIWFRLSKKGV